MSTTVSSSAVDGLVSGLDTKNIISSLITADSAVQTKLKANVTSANLKVTALQSVNSKMAALQTAADALQKAAAWTPTTASSSSSNVAVSTGVDASTGSVSVTVTQLAAGRTAVSNGAYSATDTTAAAALGYPLDVVSNGRIVGTISPSAGTLSDVAAAINKASSLGIKAVAIRVAENSYRLQITSASTGSAAGDFKLVPPTGQAAGSSYTGSGTEVSGYATLTTAADASLQVTGSVGATPVTITSKSNTFENVLPGVSLTASATGSATVTVASDPGRIATALGDLTDAANAALSDITLQTRAGVVGANGSVTGGGTLRGDSTLRDLKAQILSAVTSALGGTGTPTSAATVGLQSTKDGGLTFDKSAFLAAYAKDPAAVQKLVSTTSTTTTGPTLGGVSSVVAAADGLADRLRKVTVRAIGEQVIAGGDSAKASLVTAVTGQQTSIDDLTEQISAWDLKLADKKERYTKYYAALEVTLGKLQSQSTWLSGQLSGLSSFGGS